MIRHVKLKRRIEKHRQSLAEMHVLRFTWFTLLNVDVRVDIKPSVRSPGTSTTSCVTRNCTKSPRKNKIMKRSENCRTSTKSLHEAASRHTTAQFGAIEGPVTVATRWGLDGEGYGTGTRPAPQGTRTGTSSSP
jgi:hypothetical protein